jgi:hypothetical protein
LSEYSSRLLLLLLRLLAEHPAHRVSSAQTPAQTSPQAAHGIAHRLLPENAAGLLLGRLLAEDTGLRLSGLLTEESHSLLLLLWLLSEHACRLLGLSEASGLLRGEDAASGGGIGGSLAEESAGHGLGRLLAEGVGGLSEESLRFG